MQAMDGEAGAGLELTDHGPHGPDRTETRLWLCMLSTTKLVATEIRRRLRIEFGATLPQFDLMAQLYREKNGLRLGELSKRTMATNGNVTGLVERLEAGGLLRRVASMSDRRVTVASLTPEGTELFVRMAAAHEGWLRELMADVDPAVIASLWPAMGAVKASVSNHLSGSAFDG